MWENTATIHSILKKKNYKAKKKTPLQSFSVIKKTMRKNIVTINNVLKKKNSKTKFLISSILKKIDKYNFEKFKNKIEKLCGKTPLQSTVF
jgi:hypothetical protein